MNSSSHWRNPLVVVGATLVLFFSTQVIGALVSTPLVSLFPSQNMQLLIYVGSNLVVVSLLLVLAHTVLKFKWSSIGLSRPKLRALLSAIPAFILYFVISTLFTILATKLISGFDVNQAQEIGFKNPTQLYELVAGFVGLVILTPIFEELIFRGLLFKGFRRRFSFWPSAVAASVIFGLAHMQWNVAVDTFALGLILCYLTERSNSILPAILLHGMKNGLAFALLFIL